ncbi:alanine-zipper protein [Gimesia aquarii]|uniref:Uncharacterized protein n=1 Tax=Gimesia aquarii TaxID=2527964 RepID=A0A517VZW7_9PLAN|nr:alanine-zipper protein [Gimesia aquarii]QDT98554.1 hypothetical protein V144x_40610 [Gimesia aquarii]
MTHDMNNTADTNSMDKCDNSHEKACALDETEAPKLWREKFKVDFKRTKGCNDVKTPLEREKCLVDAIAKEVETINKAKSAEKAKKELEAIQKSAETAIKDYTTEAHKSFILLWEEQDKDIQKLLNKVECIPNWKCIIECYICPLLNELYFVAQELNGDPLNYCHCCERKNVSDTCSEEKTKCEQYQSYLNDDPNYRQFSKELAKNHYDLLHWLERDLAQKNRTYELVSNVLQAWMNPNKSLKDLLQANSELIKKCNDEWCSRTTHIVYDIFVQLLPLHFAIRPRDKNNKKWPDGKKPTVIQKEFYDLYAHLCCDEGQPIDCCNVNVGEPSIRDRLIGTQPYIVDPSEYYELICCLTKHRYLKAQEAMAKAQAALDAQKKRIEDLNKFISKDAGTLAKIAYDLIPLEVGPCDCSNALKTAEVALKTSIYADELAKKVEPIANEVDCIANNAIETADEALGHCPSDKAKQLAGEAKQVANCAKTKADDARNTAADAIREACDAMGAAKDAKELAEKCEDVDEAYEKAEKAKSSANEVKNKAELAKKCAEEAMKHANIAKKRADEALELTRSSKQQYGD